ncbi:hypothetical protein [Mesorhizobium sp. B2-8-9]|uniref:hypothetical protein n=1 Tax=Mesorhizobium sp. B2-8-9 TaxID=2589899 RepID=UPI001125D9E6|nr:hypothetical protein [Mesorhizobium sp. B2-8-9]TPI78491.1 hypothetical protein FJ423_16395 [Mesorhizobium sp. B2-8-9]
MYYQFQKPTVLKLNPDPTAADGALVNAGEIGFVLAENGNWVQLTVYDALVDPGTGWARKVGDDGDARLVEVDEPPRIEFGIWSFIKGCVDAEFWINGQDNKGPFFVLADYLIAWALIETGNLADTKNKLGNIGPKTPPGDGTGPFQLTAAEWNTFLDDPLGADYSAASRELGLDQIAGAAFLARKAMSDISAAITANDAAAGLPDTQGLAGPYIPAYIDVLLAHMFGVEMAIKFRTLKLAGQGGTAVDAVLTAPSGPFSTADVKTLLDTRKNVLRDWDSGVVETVDGAIVNVEKLLQAAFAKAYALIKDQAPEDLPNADGAAAWMPVAEAEQTAWAPLGDETTPAAQTRIRGYFQAIGQERAAGAEIPPWCGAFAGFCVNQANPALFKAITGNPLSSGSWRSFGNESVPLGDPNPPRGAVVVMSPDKGSSSASHVGFFSRYLGSDNQQVELLGGNQSDRVTLTKFDRAKMLAIRWQSAEKVADDNAGDVAIGGAAAAGQFGRLLDFIGQFESRNNYDAYFGHAGNTNDPAVASKTIGDILVFQNQIVAINKTSSACGKYQIVRDTLKGLISNGVIKKTDKFSPENQDMLAIALMKGRGLGSFLAKPLSDDQLNRFMLNLAKEWASMPVPQDTRGRFRNVKAGQSYYAGDNINSALTTVAKFREAVKSIHA